jgi:raffinose/stachyose/melibiose transport system permease protein
VGYGAAISTALSVVVIIVAIIFTQVQQRSERKDEE